MPASDALTLHTQIREQCDNPRFREYVDYYARAMVDTHEIKESDWARSMAFEGMSNALGIAETFYVSPDMHELVKLAAEDFPRDEVILREDPPSDAGFIYLPALLWAKTAEGEHQVVRAMLWFNSRIWLFGDILDPNDWQHQQLVEKGQVTPEQSASLLGRWQLCGYSLFKFNEPLPQTVHRERISLSDGTEFPYPVFEHAETITYLLAAWRLMQQSLADVTREISSIPRPVRRRAERYHLPNAVTVIELRRRKSALQGEGTGYKIDYRIPVRGHWRRVWCGPMNLPLCPGCIAKVPHQCAAEHRFKRAVYIHPTIRGPEGAPLLRRDRINALVR